MTADLYRFRQSGDGYTVTDAATGADLGTVDRLSQSFQTLNPKWRATGTDGTAMGSHYRSRRDAAGALADHAAPAPTDVAARLEYLWGEIRAQRISYGELAELHELADHIDRGDVELLEWAGVPEFCEHGQRFDEPCAPCAVAGHEPTDVVEDQDDDGSGEAPVLDHERDAYDAPAPVDDRDRMTAPTRRGRYLLERTLPDGTVKAWPGTMSPREAGRAVAYCLHDNLGATRQTATRSAQRIESHPVGEWLDLHGYRFRLVTEAPTEDVEPARVELGAFHDPRVACCDRDAADCDCP